MERIARRFLDYVPPAARCRFLEEARSQACVKHENVLEVCEIGEFDGRPYYATRHVEARPLLDVRESTSLAEKAQLLAQAADGLHAAHRQGLLHRGVKPSSIVVEQTQEGLRARITDFGTALLDEPDPSATSYEGAALDFVAPERLTAADLRGKGNTEQGCDVYALGVTSYQFFSGRLPYTDTIFAQGLRRMLEDEPRPLRALIEDFPEDLERIVMRCMAKDPAVRYRSARKVAKDLRSFARTNLRDCRTRSRR